MLFKTIHDVPQDSILRSPWLAFYSPHGFAGKVIENAVNHWVASREPKRHLIKSPKQKLAIEGFMYNIASNWGLILRTCRPALAEYAVKTPIPKRERCFDTSFGLVLWDSKFSRSEP